MIKKRSSTSSSSTSSLLDINDQDTISNFKIKKEDFILDFDERFISQYEQQSNFITPKKILNHQDKENSPFSIKSPLLLSRNNSFTSNLNLSFDYSKPLSPKTHILNIKEISPKSKKVAKSPSPSNLSPPPIITNSSKFKTPINEKYKLRKFSSFKESQFNNICDNSSDSSDTGGDDNINNSNSNNSNDDHSVNCIGNMTLDSPSLSSQTIIDAPSTPSPSKLFQKLSFKSPPSSSSTTTNKTTTTTTTPIIKKQLFSNKRILDIKTEKTPTKTELHPSKLQLKPTSTSILKNKSTLPTTTTTTTTTTSSTTTTIKKPTTNFVNTPSRKSISTTTTTPSTTTTTTTTPLKRNIDTTTVNSSKSLQTPVMNKALTTTTTPSKKPRMSIPAITPNKIINNHHHQAPPPTTPSINKSIIAPPVTPSNTNNSSSSSTVKRLSSTPIINKPTIKRLSTLNNNNTSSRKSYVPPPPSTTTTTTIDTDFEERIQQALLAEAKGTYVGGSLLSQSSPEKVEHSEWSPVRRKSNLHEVHAKYYYNL